MPLEAMTGFGTARKESPNGDISVDVKSLNNKYLDISIKTHQFSNELESLVKNNIKQLFDRGSFEVRIDINIEISHTPFSILVGEDVYSVPSGRLYVWT